MEEDVDLPDGRKVRVTERALENFDDHGECPFCQGRAAAHRGDGDGCNPFPKVDFPPVRRIGTRTTTGYGCRVMLSDPRSRADCCGLSNQTVVMTPRVGWPPVGMAGLRTDRRSCYSVCYC
jgi:hypothetical protein